MGTIHGWLNAEAPSAAAELAQLRAALAGPGPKGGRMDGRMGGRTGGPMIGPVPPLALPRALLDRLAAQIAALLRLDASALGDGFIKLAETLHLVGHARAPSPPAWR